MAGPAGFEPATSGLEGRSFGELWASERANFVEWLSSEVGEETKKDYVRALDKFFGRHMIKTLGDLEKALRAEGHKRNLSKAVRKFSKYLKERGIIDSSKHDKIKGIARLKATGIREVFISDEDIKKAYAEVLQRGKPAETLFLLLVFSGIRLKQAVELLRTFDYSKVQAIDEKAAKYPIFSLSKGKKKAFWAYGPRDFFELLEPWEVKYNTAKDLVSYGRVSANSIRKWHYTFMIRQGMPADVADFIQGRVSGSVGAMHYLNKTLLADEWYYAVVEDLKLVLEGGWRSKRARLGISLNDERR